MSSGCGKASPTTPPTPRRGPGSSRSCPPTVSREHDPGVENLSTATTAVEEALEEGSRVNGAGIFWWWGFYYDEEGEGEYEGAPDRAAWLTRTLRAPFCPERSATASVTAWEDGRKGGRGAAQTDAIVSLSSWVKPASF